MNPSFVEELFLRIEERLNSLDGDIHDIKSDISLMKREISLIKKNHGDIEQIKRFVWAGRTIVLAVWGIIVTVLNLILDKVLKINL